MLCLFVDLKSVFWSWSAHDVACYDTQQWHRIVMQRGQNRPQKAKSPGDLTEALAPTGIPQPICTEVYVERLGSVNAKAGQFR